MKQKLIYTIEGRILITGFILFFLLLSVIGYIAIVDIETSKTMGLAFFAHTFGGRAAGIGLCIMNEFSATFTIVYNLYLEVLIVCFSYSIFVLTTNNYIRVLWIAKLMERLAQKAVEQKKKVQSFGWIGLFVFVMLPLPVTGPVVGSIIGYLLKINLFKNFTATGAGTSLAIIVWFFFFDFLEQQFQIIQYVFAVVIIIVLLTHHKAIRNFFSNKET